MNNNVNLLGIPIDLGAENLGVDIGPQAFRYQKIVEKLISTGLNVEDLGNVEVKPRSQIKIGDSHLKYADEVIRVNLEVAEKTYQSIVDKKRVVAIGGDHSMTLGLVSGASVALKQDLGLIYFDAHGDMNTKETSLSGNIHGMHVASLLGFGDQSLIDLFRPNQKLKTSNFLHIGGSDWDQAELELVKSANLDTFMLSDVLSFGLAPLFTKIDELCSRVSHIWISLDLDCIDQIYAPGAGMPNAKGLTYREMAVIAQYIGQKCPVIGVDVVEYNPLQDIDNKTAELGIELIAKFLGRDYSWYTGYMSRNKIQE